MFIVLDTFSRQVFFFSNVTTVIASLGLALIGCLKAPASEHKKWWVLFYLFGAFYTSSVVVTSLLDRDDIALLFGKISMAIGVLSLVFMAFFSWSFSGTTRFRTFFLGLTIMWAGMLIPVFFFTDWIMAGTVSDQLSANSPVAGPLMPIYASFLLHTWSMTFVLFSRLLINTRGLKRTQSAYILVAFFLIAAGSIGSLLPAWSGSENTLLVLPTTLLPLGVLTITIAIIRYRLMDIRTVFHKTAVWFVLLLLLLVPVYLILLVGSGFLKNRGDWEKAVWMVLLFMLGYFYLRAVKPKLDHLFQRRAYNRRKELDRFSKAMTSLRKEDRVVEHLLEVIGRTLYPSKIVLHILDRDEHEFSSTVAWPADPGRQPEKLCSVRESSFLQSLKKIGMAAEYGQVRVDPAFSDVRSEAVSFFDSTGAEVFAPLISGKRLIGVLEVYPKKNLRPYSADDLEFLEQLCASGSVGLANAILFAEVDTQRSELFELTANLEQRVQERTDALQKANDRLRNLDTVKSRFFANISHEFRTPLSLVLSPLELIMDGSMGELNESQLGQLSGIHSNALRLLKFIDDLLDLSKLEDAKLRLRLERVDLASLLGRISDYTKPLAERKNISLELVVDERVNVEADEEKIERIVINLLGNALKFTPEGGSVELRVGRNGNMARVVVEDNGVGICADELPHIFDRFHQSDDSMSRKKGGSGIGLSLAMELALLHNGKLEVDSLPGKGSSFCLEIPLSSASIPSDRIERRVMLQQVDELRRENDRGMFEWDERIRASDRYRYMDIYRVTDRRTVQRIAPKGKKKARLLVVDDNVDLLQYLEQVLGEQYKVWYARDGKTALESLRTHRHDLVISDVMMPGMSGLELCRRIKSSSKLQDTPVILLTAMKSEKNRINGHHVGADQYLTKPFRASEILAAIEALLKNRLRHSEVAAQRRAVSLETLLAGLAHELRNACHQARNAQAAVVKLSDRALSDKSLQDDEIHRRLKRMQDISVRALDRISAVVLSLQQYSSSHMMVSWSEVDLDRMISAEIRHLTLADQKGVNIEADLSSGVVLRGPREELRQMILNLLENALHAVDQGGRVAVSTCLDEGMVVLSVEDNGCGIAPEDRDRIFDLFFTTRDPGRGIGLGLALAQKTIQDMGGSIVVDSEPGEGTTFRLKIPALEGSGSDKTDWRTGNDG